MEGPPHNDSMASTRHLPTTPSGLADELAELAGAIARDGEYSEAALGALPPPHLARFVGEPTGGGRRSLLPAVRRLVEFRQLKPCPHHCRRSPTGPQRARQ